MLDRLVPRFLLIVNILNRAAPFALQVNVRPARAALSRVEGVRRAKIEVQCFRLEIHFHSDLVEVEIIPYNAFL